MRTWVLIAIAALLSFVGQLVLAQEVHRDTIYGTDGRKDFFELTSKKLKTLARKSVALFSKTSLSKTTKGSHVFKGESYGSAFKLCEGEKYIEQPSIAFCSGVLIGDRYVLTAAHCIKESTCSKTNFVFDYFIDDKFNQTEVPVVSENIYGCKEVVQRVKSGDLEFAVVELDRVVGDRLPVRLKPEAESTENL